MAKIVVHQNKIEDREAVIKVCPFNALEFEENDELILNAACKMCKICIRRFPEIFEWVEDVAPTVNKDEWRGVTVYIDHIEGDIHPVSFELIGKARKMANKIDHPVQCLIMGNNITKIAEQVLHYGADEVFVYDKPQLHDFRIEPYAAVFEDYINKNKPSIVLVGGTTVGRSLAPRVAARFRTGLTADCTILDIQDNTDLDQIRPAYGGNIMAHIHTPNHRPQFATVRYKIFDAPMRTEEKSGKLTFCDIADEKLKSKITVIEIKKKEKVKSIEDADVIVVAGRAFKKEEDLSMIYELADELGAMVATTRPLIEAGWMDARLQIGLSGRTVKPKLIIACGVSGAIQFVAGMNNSDMIIAINEDPKAQIFNVAHYAIVGDIYEILPALTTQIKEMKKVK
ncbi:MAG: FAD-binding protein [Candidatus Marinimicrobia bacterium]|nr:FAD-binding protein [Candidatus Neomarinimicrobiota bacterium]